MIRVEEVRFSKAELAEYRERGYLVTPRLIGDEAIGRLCRAADRLFELDYDRPLYPFDRLYHYDLSSLELRKVNNGWWLDDEVRSLVLSPKLGAMVAPLMEAAGVRVWHDQVVSKPGAGPERTDYREANIGWHQDYAHWQVASSERMCTLWLALQDTDLANGGMRTIVGSHRLGLIPDADSFHEKDLDLLRTRYAGDHPWIDEPCVLKAGQASIHHCLCMHGSGPNLTLEPRRCVIIHYMPDGTSYRGRVAPPGPVKAGRKGNRHANVPLLGPNARAGTPFAGEAFPRVWPFDPTLPARYGVDLDVPADLAGTDGRG